MNKHSTVNIFYKNRKHVGNLEHSCNLKTIYDLLVLEVDAWQLQSQSCYSLNLINVNPDIFKLQLRIVRKGMASEEGDLGLLWKTAAYSKDIRN
jgi:hypothetical protein